MTNGEYGPTPEQMGVLESGNKEVASDKDFRDFVDKHYSEQKDKFLEGSRSGIQPENYEVKFEIKETDPSNNFVITDRFSHDIKWGRFNRSVSREYFGAHLDTEGVAVFTPTAKAVITEDQTGPHRMIDLTKYGRPGRTSGDQSPESENIWIFKAINEAKDRIENINKMQSTVNYTLYNLKGESAFGENVAGSYVNVEYDFEGTLIGLHVFHRDAQSEEKYLNGVEHLLYTDPSIIGERTEGDDFAETLEEFKHKVSETKEMTIGEYRLGLNYDSSRGIIEVIINDKTGKPEYRVVVPESIDVDNVIAELGADQLEKNPYQPANGVKGEGLGDMDWRTKSFPDLTGIRVTLIE